MIRLIIADDHTIVRSGLKQLFSMAKDIEVLGEASNGSELLQLLVFQEADLVLLDLSMPGNNGIQLISRLKEAHPELRILVLSMHDELPVAKRALNAGAMGFITKGSGPETLLAAARKVAGGRRYIDPSFAEQLMFDHAFSDSTAPHEKLSTRELQVLTLLTGGKSVNEIADELLISNKTVSTHKSRLMEKLGIRSNAELVRYAIEQNLVA